MRGAWPTGFLLLTLLSAGCWEQTPAPVAPAPEPVAERPGGVPSWVPASTPQQAALLAPSEHAIKAPATRVFPDLQRFAYANNRPLTDLEDAGKFTRMVTKVLNDSPRFYALEELPPGAANTVVQYGPPAGEADGYKVVKRNDEGVGQLVPAAHADEARAAVAQASELLKGGDVEGALQVYRDALTRAPGVPALHMALGQALAGAGRASEAELAYKAALAVDASFAPAHLALAEIADKRNNLPLARRALTEALAYHPSSARGLELLRKLGGGANGGVDGGWYDPPPAPPGADAAADGARPQPFPIFLDVDAVGAIHVATARSNAAQVYGGCRAVLRYEPELRAQIFQQPREAPYALSVAEEVVCLEAALGAYLAGKRDKSDPDLDRLLGIAREDGLSGYVMFEILGQRRPERARAAPADVHRETAAYLTRWVLTRREAIPEGVYSAER